MLIYTRIWFLGNWTVNEVGEVLSIEFKLGIVLNFLGSGIPVDTVM